MHSVGSNPAISINNEAIMVLKALYVLGLILAGVLVVYGVAIAGYAMYQSAVYESPCHEDMGCKYYKCLANESQIVLHITMYEEKYQSCLMEQAVK